MAYLGVQYGNVTLYVVAEQEDNVLVVPDTEVDPGIVETRIPYANVAQMQFIGLGNAKLQLKVEIRGDDQYFLFKSYLADGVSRNIEDTFQVGISHPNMQLTKLKGKRNSTVAEWYADVEFTQVDQ